jgi:hypothetical protein
MIDLTNYIGTGEYQCSMDQGSLLTNKYLSRGIAVLRLGREK